MSKADSLRSTPVSGLNRRGLLAGAAGAVALVGIVPTALAAAAMPTDASDTLATARRIATLRWDAFGASACCHDDSPEQRSYDALADELGKALEQLTARICAKPTLSVSDLGALAIIAREAQAQDPNGIEDDLATAEEPGDRAMLQLMASVLTMAEGGANV